MNPKLLVIVGETASGKSRLALELAQKLNGEIICADSWTVRREVNVGTDKPTDEDRRLVPHHLLDIVGPDEDFTAAVFKSLAEEAVIDISSRGELPIMVGGSGLYIDGVIFNYSFMPAGDRYSRQELNELAINQLIDMVNQQVISLDDIDTRNKRRLIRLLETNGDRPKREELRDNTLVLGVKRESNELLKEVIEKRVDQMIAAGLEQEVRMLQLCYGWDCEALKGVGYKQWRGYIEGTQGLAETRQQIITATANLAKKQRTWFKRNKSIHWLVQPIKTADVVDLVTTELINQHFI